MNRTENDLREALRDLERHARDGDAPTAAGIAEQAGTGRHRTSRRVPRRLAPIGAAAAVAATAAAVITATSLSGGGGDPSPTRSGAAVNQPSPSSITSTPTEPVPSTPEPTGSTWPRSPRPSAKTANATPDPAAVDVLDDAATMLRDKPWTEPPSDGFFYRRTTDMTSWVSVDGSQDGRIRFRDDKSTAVIRGCVHGHTPSDPGDTCEVADVPHYRHDAPTDPTAWDNYIERLSPGNHGIESQAKSVFELTWTDLLAPKAEAALLRYFATCPGLHTVDVRPVAREQLIGVTCPSMNDAGVGLVFDASTHEFVGHLSVDPDGRQSDHPAEIIRATGYVSSVGQTP